MGRNRGQRAPKPQSVGIHESKFQQAVIFVSAAIHWTSPIKYVMFLFRLMCNASSL